MDFITLSQLNHVVGKQITQALPDTYWVMAETSDVRLNRNGHCYLELVEKNERTHALVAKARAYIWSSAFQLLNPYFEEKTGQLFTSGLKVLLRVSVDFHPLYGYGLNILDIDPTYTIGDMQRHRQEILNQLEEEGVLSLNKELQLTTIPQRIAIITSSTAAGYEDFMNHLMQNKPGFVFYPVLFSAVMQGDQTEKTIIAALDRIYQRQDDFDVVVIIRGGGATSDLASFDTYALAANCAQFPLPIITGIGHERDDTVLDFVSYYRAKTPTAVADYLVGCLENSFLELMACQEEILFMARDFMSDRQESLSHISRYLPVYSHAFIEKHAFMLEQLKEKLNRSVSQSLHNQKQTLEAIESFCRLSSPEYILAKGYSITLKNGKALKATDSLREGDRIESVLSEGNIVSLVKEVRKK